MLIIDMPMPTRCDRCPCSLVIDGMWYCKAFDDSTPIYGNPPKKRRDWCPIKGVLPEEHGDLIDRDVASEAFTRAFDELDRDVPVFSANGVVGVLKNQQAVIAAERKDNGKSC